MEQSEESSDDPSEDDDDVTNLGLMAILDNDIQNRESIPEQ